MSRPPLDSLFPSARQSETVSAFLSACLCEGSDSPSSQEGPSVSLPMQKEGGFRCFHSHSDFLFTRVTHTETETVVGLAFTQIEMCVHLTQEEEMRVYLPLFSPLPSFAASPAVVVSFRSRDTAFRVSGSWSLCPYVSLVTEEENPRDTERT